MDDNCETQPLPAGSHSVSDDLSTEPTHTADDADADENYGQQDEDEDDELQFSPGEDDDPDAFPASIPGSRRAQKVAKRHQCKLEMKHREPPAAKKTSDSEATPTTNLQIYDRYMSARSTPQRDKSTRKKTIGPFDYQRCVCRLCKGDMLYRFEYYNRLFHEIQKHMFICERCSIWAYDEHVLRLHLFDSYTQQTRRRNNGGQAVITPGKRYFFCMTCDTKLSAASKWLCPYSRTEFVRVVLTLKAWRRFPGPLVDIIVQFLCSEEYTRHGCGQCGATQDLSE